MSHEWLTRYEIFDADDVERVHALGANSPRGAFSKIKQLINNRNLDFIIVTDNLYGITMTVYPKNNVWTVAHRFHDYSWQAPEAGLVTIEEAKAFSSNGDPEVVKHLKVRRAEAEKQSLSDLRRAILSFGIQMKTGGKLQY